MAGPRPNPTPRQRCAACGAPVAPDAERIVVHGVPFHVACARYRSPNA